MKVLFATSEAAPIKKFGGLGDVSGSLPKALEKIGVDIDVILPYYSDIDTKNYKIYKHLDLQVTFNNQTSTVEYFKTKLPGSNVDVILPRANIEFTGDFLSDAEFFAYFDKCVVEYIKSQYNTYHVVHCNDWHTGFITHLLEDEIGDSRPKTLLTIHNLAYQGVSSPELVKEVGFLPGKHPLIDWDVSDGDVNMLLQAITSCDFLNTVSESYADELLTAKYGKEFSDILKNREARFVGILNGVDYSQFEREYDHTNWRVTKDESKKALYAELGLSELDKPLFSFISRLDPGQKGLDILINAVPRIVELGGNFVLLGTGDPKWEEKFAELENDNSLAGSIDINIRFDVKLAERIYRASDFFLVPSKYEPCGLTQMISMWYGTVPIVHNVGGLKDTVKNGMNGFTFDAYNSKALGSAIQSALGVYNDNRELYKRMVTTAMQEDFSWDVSAQKYKNLYSKLNG